MRKSDSFLVKALTAVSWSINTTANKKNTIKLDDASFLTRYLHALSYSEHDVRKTSKKNNKESELLKVSIKLEKLWDAVQLLMKQRKFTRAEDKLLKIIKIDKYNATAYNRLGILYAKSQRYDESIECFKLATKLEPTASSHHNLALIYYETNNLKLSLKYFKIAIKYDGRLASSFISIAKIYEKLGNEKEVINNLQLAMKIEPTKDVSKLLYNAYRIYGYDDQANKIEKQMLDSLHQEVREVKELEHKKVSDESIFSSNMFAGYQY